MYPPEYQQILDFLDSNPEYLHDMRVRLLSPDLIALPEQFAQLVGLVAELGNKLDAFAEATDRRLTALEDHAVETIRRLNALEADVSNIKTDVSNIKTDVSTTKTDLGNIKTDLGNIKTDLGTIKTQVATLNGDRAESRARQNILNIARDELNLTRGRILLARGRDTAPGLLESITAAEENGLITRQQADNALYADIIIRARRDDDQQYVHAVFEVSRTIRLSDIQRAHERANTVAAATNEHTIAAVMGELIQPQQRVQADEMGVKVLLPLLLQQGQAGDETPAPIS